MTPKQQYEARKAERKRQSDEWRDNYQAKQAGETLWMADMFDRFVTAAERIADALERPTVPVSTLTFDPNSSSGSKVANSFGGK